MDKLLRNRSSLASTPRVYASIGSDGLTDAQRSELANLHRTTVANKALSPAEKAAIARVRARRAAR